MHILLGLVGIIGALGYYFFIFKRAGAAANDAIDVAQRARGKMRRNAFKKKVEGSVLTAVDDPRIAVTAMLVKLAEVKGPLLGEERTEVEAMVGSRMEMDKPDETVEFSLWLCREVVEPKDMMRGFRDLWREALSMDQRMDFVEMAHEVSTAGGQANSEQAEIIRNLKLALQIPSN